MENPAKISIELTPYGHISCILHGEDGSLEPFEADQNLLRELVNQSLIEKNDYLRLGPMPDNYVDALVFDKDNFHIVTEFKTERLPFRYIGKGKGEHTLQVMYPNMLFGFIVRDGKVGTSYAVALKKPYSESKEQNCYMFPFGNVFSGGKVCWGGVFTDDMANATLESAGKLHYNFLLSSYNDHLNQGPSAYVKAGRCSERFDDTLLIPMTNCENLPLSTTQFIETVLSI